jgi:site-specific DNA-methyltransferase (adenine-specific)
MTLMPYFADDHVELYHGDMREVLPALDVRADAVVTDPPYGETSLAWDRWPDGWPALAADVTDRLWCFGTLGMFMAHASEFEGWRGPRSIVWEKHNGSGFEKQFFKVVHELAGYFYRGSWEQAHEEVPRTRYHGPAKTVLNRGQTPHTGAIGSAAYADDGTRLMRSVIQANSTHGHAMHPTQKPILDPLIRYSVPLSGLVLDPFAGSGSTLLTARSLGRRAVGIEADEAYCEAAARRLDELDLFAGGA